jgi:glycosyltransferase involved in cell wall biosynthesis
MTSVGPVIARTTRSPTVVPLTVIIPTLNEERNLAKTLDSVVGWAKEVIVFDSLSHDRTSHVAKDYGATFVQRRFDNYSAHKNWALENISFQTEWVLFLDADERLSPALRQEISDILSDDGRGCAGYYVPRQVWFMGTWMKHGGVYPNLNLRLFRHALGRYEDRLVHEHVVLNGKVGYLRNDLIHNDYKGLEMYIARHNVYSSMEALEALRLQNRIGEGNGNLSLRGSGLERRRLLKELSYRYLPARPLFKFIWMYLMKAGFLDGRAGFRYCVLQAFCEYQVSLKRIELECDPESPIRHLYDPHG